MTNGNEHHTPVFPPVNSGNGGVTSLRIFALIAVPAALGLLGLWLLLGSSNQPENTQPAPAPVSSRPETRDHASPAANDGATGTTESAVDDIAREPSPTSRTEHAQPRAKQNRTTAPASNHAPPRLDGTSRDFDNTILPHQQPLAPPDDPRTRDKQIENNTRMPQIDPRDPIRDDPSKPEGPWRRGATRTLPSVLPPTPWKAIPPTTILTRIALGSCLSQRKPQPIWDDILALTPSPDLFLMIGDNVYGDIKSPDYSELINAYKTQGRHPEFAKARTAFPFLAIWDDHDYGANDAAANFPHKQASAKLFADFWQIDTGRPASDGIYYARLFGPPGKRVQIIMLDTRSFRARFDAKTDAVKYWGRYQPAADPSRTMLGNAQWAWLKRELSRPAQIRLIVSSIQVLSDGHGFERWGNLPVERDALLRLISNTNEGGVILLSGDRHFGALYQTPLNDGGRGLLPELTSSSMNRSYGPSNDTRGPELTSDIYHQENFGLIDINWRSRTVEIGLHGIGGRVFATKKYTFSKLTGRKRPIPP